MNGNFLDRQFHSLTSPSFFSHAPFYIVLLLICNSIVGFPLPTNSVFSGSNLSLVLLVLVSTLLQFPCLFSCFSSSSLFAFSLFAFFFFIEWFSNWIALYSGETLNTFPYTSTNIHPYSFMRATRPNLNPRFRSSSHSAIPIQATTFHTQIYIYIPSVSISVECTGIFVYTSAQSLISSQSILTSFRILVSFRRYLTT